MLRDVPRTAIATVSSFYLKLTSNFVIDTRCFFFKGTLMDTRPMTLSLTIGLFLNRCRWGGRDDI